MIPKTQRKKQSYNFNTAIKRTKPSLPLRYLVDNNLLIGKVLDYGCGRGFDYSYLSSLGYSVDSYDPYWKPDGIGSKKYNTIFCNYVLNVIETDDEVASTIKAVQNLLDKDGLAYFAVRRDIKKEGFTTRGYQRVISINAPIAFYKSGSFCTYVIGKDFLPYSSHPCYN